MIYSIICRIFSDGWCSVTIYVACNVLPIILFSTVVLLKICRVSKEYINKNKFALSSIKT